MHVSNTLQKAIAMSSTEAKYLTLSKAIPVIARFQTLLGELYIKQCSMAVI